MCVCWVYFGSYVVGRAAERLRFAVVRYLFAHAKVGYFAVTLRVEQYVVEFEVAVDDALAVEKLKSAKYLGRIEACSIFGKLFRFDNMKHEVTAVKELH